MAGALAYTSGLWLTSQWHYNLLLSAGYSTLIADFSATGHGMLAIMPVITAPWPAGRRLSYQHILARPVCVAESSDRVALASVDAARRQPSAAAPTHNRS